ncbi:hypothetical protein, partial [Rheinheimera faecalis]|uniref:hypothetical protein n=1 Tax=Rheinheimera faecalis TaxID=2901141 RepID=UPI001E4C04BB
QIQERWDENSVDFRMENPAYRAAESLFNYEDALAAERAMWGGRDETNLNISTKATMAIAYPLITLGVYANGPITGFNSASESASRELLKFRDGVPGTNVYGVGSDGSNELIKSHYYQELSQHAVYHLNEYYQGDVPDGLTGVRLKDIGAPSFRAYNPIDAIVDMTSDGITMPDVVGTMTYPIEMSTTNGMVVFRGINATTLQSFSGQNILKHNLVNEKSTGMMMTSKQIIEWAYPLPKGSKK